MNRKPPRIALLLQNEDHRLPTVLPFHQQRRIQFAEPVAQPVLQLFLPHRQNAGLIGDDLCFRFGEEIQRRARIVQNQILEVLIVVHVITGAR